jgi:hypothetical protein
LLLWAAILHVMLLIVGGAKNGFGATLRALCYSRAPEVFQVLPFCGALIAWIGAFSCSFRGRGGAPDLDRQGDARGAAAARPLLHLLLGPARHPGRGLMAHLPAGMQH